MTYRLEVVLEQELEQDLELVLEQELEQDLEAVLEQGLETVSEHFTWFRFTTVELKPARIENTAFLNFPGIKVLNLR